MQDKKEGMDRREALQVFLASFAALAAPSPTVVRVAAKTVGGMPSYLADMLRAVRMGEIATQPKMLAIFKDVDEKYMQSAPSGDALARHKHKRGSPTNILRLGYRLVSDNTVFELGDDFNTETKVRRDNSFPEALEDKASSCVRAIESLLQGKEPSAPLASLIEQFRGHLHQLYPQAAKVLEANIEKEIAPVRAQAEKLTQNYKKPAKQTAPTTPKAIPAEAPKIPEVENSPHTLSTDSETVYRRMVLAQTQGKTGEEDVAETRIARGTTLFKGDGFSRGD